MSDRVFVDTNGFVYADDRSAKTKRCACGRCCPISSAASAVVSTQVMQEYFVAAIRKLQLPPEGARLRVERLHRLDVIVVRPELIFGAIDLCRLHPLSFWDALIVRAASAAGCGRLLSEGMQDGQAIDGVKIENPFA